MGMLMAKIRVGLRCRLHRVLDSTRELSQMGMEPLGLD